MVSGSITTKITTTQEYFKYLLVVYQADSTEKSGISIFQKWDTRSPVLFTITIADVYG